MHRRTRFFLPGTEQPRLLSTLLLVWLLVTVSAAALLYLGANRNIEARTYSAHFKALRATGELFLPYLLAANLMAAVAVLFAGLFYTHRVAGPIYQIEKRLGRLREGDLGVVFAVRKGDRFHSLTHALNDATGAIRARLLRVREAANRLEAAEAGSSEGQSALRDLRQALEELQA